MDSPREARRPPRPPGIALIALFLVADAILGLFELVSERSVVLHRSTLAGSATWMPALLVGISLLEAWAAIGLWRGSRRAWVLTMLLVGLGLVVGLAMRWVGEPTYVRLALYVVAAFYLNQGAVRAYVTWRPSASQPTAGPRA